MKILNVVTCIFIFSLFLFGCGGGGGSSSSNSTTDDGLYPIDPTLNFYILANSDTSTSAQKAAVKYLIDEVIGINDYTAAFEMLKSKSSLKLKSWKVYDFNVLNDLSNLEEITFESYNPDSIPYSNNPPDDLNLSRLSHLTNLKTIGIVNCDSKHVKNFSSLTNLETVSIWLTDDYDNMDFIKNNTNFKNLNLTCDKESTNLSVLKTLTGIESLSVFNFGVDDLSPISDLTNLKKLEISETFVKNFDFLTKLENLESLEYSLRAINLIENLSVIPTLKSLKSMEITTSPEYLFGETVPIGNLKRFSSLTNLKLNSLYFSSIDWQENLPDTLITLDLSYNAIESLDGIEALTNLKELDLSNNKITSIEGLQNMSNLEVIKLYGNSIDNIDILLSLPNLKEITAGAFTSPPTIINFDAFIGSGIKINGVVY